MDQVIRLLVFCTDNLDSTASIESSLVDETFHRMRRSRWSPRSEFDEFVDVWRSVAFWIRNRSYQGSIPGQVAKRRCLWCWGWNLEHEFLGTDLPSDELNKRGTVFFLRKLPLAFKDMSIWISASWNPCFDHWPIWESLKSAA